MYYYFLQQSSSDASILLLYEFCSFYIVFNFVFVKVHTMHLSKAFICYCIDTSSSSTHFELISQRCYPIVEQTASKVYSNIEN